MRFRFCGELDAPDWLLAEISTISKLSSVRVRLIVGQILSHLIEQQLDGEKLAKQAQGLVSEKDLAAAVAALHFVLANAAKYDVDELVLAKELEQLGLPKEHAEAVCKPYSKDRDRLRSAVVAATLQLDPLLLTRWAVDLPLASGGDGQSAAEGAGAATIRLEFAAPGGAGGSEALSADEAQLRLLVWELKQARDAMLQATDTR